MKYSLNIAAKIIELYGTGRHSVQDICDAVGITRVTFYDWKNSKKSFGEKIDAAHILRMEAIGEMALSGLALLVQKQEFEETTVEYTEGKDGKPKIKSQKKTKKVIMPNPGMITLALINLKSADFKQRQTIAHTGNDDGPINNEVTIRVGYGKKDNGEDETF